jgi:hypothetical protein
MAQENLLKVIQPSKTDEHNLNFPKTIFSFAITR